MLCTLQLLFCQLQQYPADLTLLYSAWRKTAANSKVNYVRKRRRRRRPWSLLLLSCFLYSQSLSLHQSCSFHFPCCTLQCSGGQERNSSICCLQPPLMQPLRCNPKKYILFTYTNNYSPQLGDSNFGFPASNRFFTGQ